LTPERSGAYLFCRTVTYVTQPAQLDARYPRFREFPDPDRPTSRGSHFAEFLRNRSPRADVHLCPEVAGARYVNIAPLPKHHAHHASTATPFLLFALFSCGAPRAQGADLELDGIVRDFDSTHADFDVTPSKGTGHYVGSVQPSLGPDGRPQFAGWSGYKIVDQWTDSSGDPIAPHLYETAPLTVTGSAFYVDGEVDLRQVSVHGVDGDALIVTNATTAGAVELRNNADLVGSVYIGPGGDPDAVVQKDGNCSITGGVGVLGSPFALPVLAEPALGSSVGDVTMSGGTIWTDLHADVLTLKKNKTVWIWGDVTILCDEFSMENNAKLALLPGARVELFVRNDVTLRNNSRFNENTHDPTRATINYLGAGDVTISNHHSMWASVIAPEGHLHVENNTTLTGSFIVGQLTAENGGTELIMIDGAVVGAGESCGIYNDTEGARGVSNSGAISSASSFDQWFHDDLDANLSTRRMITLTDDGAGNYVLSDDDFYPIDGIGKGNEGSDHNSFFTYAIEARFQYAACSGQYVELQGGDGIWLFINDSLAVDLGGVQANQLQRFEVDRFDLEDGETYTFSLFYANRNDTSSTFGLRTNLELWQGSLMATATLPFD